MSHPEIEAIPSDTWEALWQSESVVGRWLSTLFSAELDAESLARYAKGEAGPILQLLQDEHGLDEEVRRMQNALAGLTVLSSARLELAADFAELFLIDGRTSTPPYASFWNGGVRQFQSETAQRLANRLAQSGFSVNREFNEPADHLAVMLDYLSDRCDRLAALPEGERTEEFDYLRTYLSTELCNWLPLFATCCNETRPASDFYPAVASLTAAWCQQLANTTSQLQQGLAVPAH